MESREHYSHPILDELKQRRREAADRVRCILRELEVAEIEFERATQALQDALECDAA